MKIGYDAKRIFHNTTGLGNYSRDLLSIMSELYKNFDYYLYNPKKKKIDRFKFKNNTFEKLPNGFFWKLISGYWRQGPIVKQLKNDAISIYHGLTGELPQGIHKTNIKTVVTIHDLIFLRYPKLYSIFDRKIHYSKAKFAANKADKIIAISEQTKRDIVDYLDIKENKIEVIYQGCHSSFKILKDETEKSKVRKKFNLPKQFILNVGAINKRKNIITLLSSLRNINSTLIIVGSKTSFFENVKTFIVENNLNDKVIGTGPYKLDSWVSSTKLRLIKNDKYRKSFYPGQGDRIANSRNLLKDSGKVIPFIEKVEYNVYKEAQTRWLNFKAKKIDFLIIPKDNYSSAVDPNGNLTKELKEEKIKLQIFPTLTYWWLSFNMRDPLLGENLNLRKAIAHAIDVERYIKVFTNNIGQKSNSIYPPGIPGYDPSSQLPYEHNIQKAKEFLKKAGYPNGKGLPTLTYDVRGVSATNRQQADFVKSELGKVGIKVQVALNNFPAFLEKARHGKLQFWQDGWALDYPDSENVLQLLTSRNHAPGPNSTFYSNDKFDKLFNKMKVLPNGEEKVRIMKEMEEIIVHDLPWVMQYYSRNYILYHERLNNYRHSDLIYNNFKYLRLNQK